jgi:hypothetical protein
MRWELFEAAGKRIVEMAKQHYEQGNARVLPREIAFSRRPSRGAATSCACSAPHSLNVCLRQEYSARGNSPCF